MEKEGAVETALASELVSLTSKPTEEKCKIYIGCFRQGEDHSNTIGWQGGDCRICVYDPENNSKCKEYIPCRVFLVAPREKNVFEVVE